MPERANELKSSKNVIESCIRFGEVVSQEKSHDKSASIAVASAGVVASIVNHVLVQNVEIARKLVPVAVAEPGKTLSILPLAHIFGLAFDFLFLFSCGCHINIFTEKPAPARLLKALSDVKPFIFLTVPLLVEKIFRSKVIPALNKPALKILTKIPGLRRLLFNKVRSTILETFGGNLGKAGFFIGGAAISKDVDKVMKKIRIPYAVGYGMTECGPLISYVASAHPSIDDIGGVAGPTIELRIDSDKPAKVPGEIQVRGDVVTIGYYKNEEANKASFTSDGWLKTGDMGTQDRNGTVYIKGRCKNMILTGSGQNIYPEEIEELINQQQYVLESLVVGRKNALVALIVADYDTAKKDGLNEEEMHVLVENNVMALNSRLPSYSQIGRCEFRKEQFEKTPKLSIKRFMYN
jgi:long-chain acyl-CoA synthetase